MLSCTYIGINITFCKDVDTLLTYEPLLTKTMPAYEKWASVNFSVEQHTKWHMLLGSQSMEWIGCVNESISSNFIL